MLNEWSQEIAGKLLARVRDKPTKLGLDYPNLLKWTPIFLSISKSNNQRIISNGHPEVQPKNPSKKFIQQKFDFSRTNVFFIDFQKAIFIKKELIISPFKK
jgi:hypothetical protein